MAKRNRIRYQTKGNTFPRITLTGKIFLRHRDDVLLSAAQKGDVQIFLSTDSLPGNMLIGDYEEPVGVEGYLKADVHDGKGWKPLSLEEFFTGREYYFSKRERPIDTYHFCLDILQKARGAILMRTYREHYVREEA